MAHSYADAGGITSFTVTKSNPSGNIIRFVVSDPGNRLQGMNDIQMVLKDAIDQFIEEERDDLDTNGDTDVLGQTENYAGDGYARFTYVLDDKKAEVTLASKTNITTSGTYTCEAPFAVL